MKTIESATQKERNWDLVREILLHSINGDFNDFKEAQAKISRDALSYHLKILIDERYILGDPYMVYENGRTYFDTDYAELTWKGNDLLDSIRNDSVWKNVKSKLSIIGGVCSVEILSAVATNVAKSMLGIN